MTRWMLPLIAFSLAAPALAQSAGGLTIGGERFAQDEIIDARAIASETGQPAILVTFGPKAAERLRALSGGRIGKTLPMVLDGTTLIEPVVHEAIGSGAITISGLDVDFAQAEAIAKRISGKEPVPEEFEE